MSNVLQNQCWQCPGCRVIYNFSVTSCYCQTKLSIGSANTTGTTVLVHGAHTPYCDLNRPGRKGTEYCTCLPQNNLFPAAEDETVGHVKGCGCPKCGGGTPMRPIDLSDGTTVYAPQQPQAHPKDCRCLNCSARVYLESRKNG